MRLAHHIRFYLRSMPTDEGGSYEIRLKGRLDARWAARFDGLSLTYESAGTTLIHGPVVDQAALHGLLTRVRDLGLPLISVTRVSQLTKGTRTVNPQTLARLTGVLFLITYITSIPAFFVFYAPVLKDPGYITGAGPDTSVLVGAFLEVLLIIANIGTALALFPVLKRQNEVLALGYVTARLVECGFIAVGILSLVTVVTLRQEAAGADAASLTLVGQALVAIKIGRSCWGPASSSAWERADAGLPDVPVRPGAAAHGRAGAHRWRCSCASRGVAVLFGRPAARRLGAEHRDHARVLLGAVARYLSHRQRIQAIRSRFPSRARTATNELVPAI